MRQIGINIKVKDEFLNNRDSNTQSYDNFPSSSSSSYSQLPLNLNRAVMSDKNDNVRIAFFSFFFLRVIYNRIKITQRDAKISLILTVNVTFRAKRNHQLNILLFTVNQKYTKFSHFRFLFASASQCSSSNFAFCFIFVSSECRKLNVQCTVRGLYIIISRDQSIRRTK